MIYLYILILLALGFISYALLLAFIFSYALLAFRLFSYALLAFRLFSYAFQFFAAIFIILACLTLGFAFFKRLISHFKKLR